MLKPTTLSPVEVDVARILYADHHGWKHINPKSMEGIPPVGPYVFRPLPVPGMESSKGPHSHCRRCWAELAKDAIVCPSCLSFSPLICSPEFCGSS